MADEGLVSYPYSTREVVNIVRHLERFPTDPITQAISSPACVMLVLDRPTRIMSVALRAPTSRLTHDRVAYRGHSMLGHVRCVHVRHLQTMSVSNISLWAQI